MIEALILFFLILVVLIGGSGVSIYAILAVAGVIAVVFVVLVLAVGKHQTENITKVVKAQLLFEVPVYKEEIQNTGFSISWRGYGRSYYRYKDVLHHYECTFMVEYEGGKTGVIKCRKPSFVYNQLIIKCNDYGVF